MNRRRSFERDDMTSGETLGQCRCDRTDGSTDIEEDGTVSEQQISNPNGGFKYCSLLRALLKIEVADFARDFYVDTRNPKLADLEITCHCAESSQQR